MLKQEDAQEVIECHLYIKRQYKIPAIIVGLIFLGVLVKAFTIKPTNKTTQSEKNPILAIDQSESDSGATSDSTLDVSFKV